MIWPPSATLGVALSDTVVVSSVSVMVVTAGTLPTVRPSKPPPLVAAIVAATLPASTYTSSFGAATAIEPVVAPAAMAITAPLDSVTLSGVFAACDNVAV